MIASEDKRHGTVAGYNRIPCREACCRKAMADYKAKWKRDKILGRDRVVSSLGAHRRAQALVALGWSQAKIARRLGMNPENFSRIMQSDIVFASTDRRIRKLYDALSMTLPPERTRAEKQAASYARTVALRRGYVPPLAWDDRDLDDPNAVPHGATKTTDDDIDHVVVQRLLDGKRIDSTPAEKAEAIRRWMANGGSRRAICQMHGWHESRYKQEAS